jgi:hypothetical protein
MKIRTVQADPSGNITLFVLDPVPLEQRRDINENSCPATLPLNRWAAFPWLTDSPKWK